MKMKLGFLSSGTIVEPHYNVKSETSGCFLVLICLLQTIYLPRLSQVFPVVLYTVDSWVSQWMSRGRGLSSLQYIL